MRFEIDIKELAGEIWTQLRTQMAEQDLQDVFRVGLDCLPINRRSLLLAVMKEQDVTALPIPRTIRDRQLEELKELKIVERDGAG